ncbi:hypothetical protein VaNZ11_015340 [Volvox africanus]|uniref:Pherophorin domain-containing protein n=1 Tax=Volvox africanus TaxID=51714 RepID=A0ABQ5SM13_9CHLO|nr:hypothetical protein VaNZ11_015340 [Volvox africanus]
MPRPIYSWPRGLALLALAGIFACQMVGATSFEHVTRRVLQTGPGINDNIRKGMGWVVTNFPLRAKVSCDPTFYHSPLALNISRPDRSSFCVKITSKMPDVVKYTCQQPASAGQVNRVQVLVAAGCIDALAAVTVDGRPWSNITYDNASNILSIDRIASLPSPDPANPADHTLCIALRPDHDTCGSLTSFCAPAYGPQPSCAIMIADNKGDCCPVNRVSYTGAALQTRLLYRLVGRFLGGCETIKSDADLRNAFATQYRVALGLPAGRIQFLSYTCRTDRMVAIFSATGLKVDEPEQIAERSAALLKPLTSLLGLVGVRASYYEYEPPSPPPSPPRRQQPVRTAPQVGRSPPLSQQSTPSVPIASSPSPPPYGSQSPPVYGGH